MKDKILKTLKRIFKPTKKKVIIFCILVVIIGLMGACVHSVRKGIREAMSGAVSGVSEVTRGNVEATITGSSSVEPYESYDILPPASGDILYAPYEVGDYVEKDAVLYSFDTTDLDLNMQKAQNSLSKSSLSHQQTLDNMDKLNITAPCNGTLTNVSVKAGDKIGNNAEIASIQNTNKLKVTVPFNESQIGYISKGSTAVISSSAHMTNVNGTVTHVATSPTPQSDGSVLYSVIIEFANPGSFTKGLTVGAQVNGQISPGFGEVMYYDDTTVVSETNGTVTHVYYNTGDYVKKGQVIATLSNDDFTTDLQKSNLDYSDAEISLQETRKQLEDYNVTAPISGTVLTKTSKAGDTIDKTNSTVTMMVIGDISRLKFNLDIDELDISKVSVGQQVNVTADALPNEQFHGEISEISMQGESENGVTTYTAKVVINEPGNLRPSMNVDASIVTASAENVLRVATTDIKTALGKSYVFVQDENAKKDQEKHKDEKEKNEQKSDDKQNDKSSMKREDASRMPQAPDGYRTVEIVVGVEGDEYTEVVSGLTEGQKIQQQSTSSSNNNMMMMDGMGGPPGGGPGGGAPSGNSGGGNRSGGGSQGGPRG